MLCDILRCPFSLSLSLSLSISLSLSVFLSLSLYIYIYMSLFLVNSWLFFLFFSFLSLSYSSLSISFSVSHSMSFVCLHICSLCLLIFLKLATNKNPFSKAVSVATLWLAWQDLLVTGLEINYWALNYLPFCVTPSHDILCVQEVVNHFI